MPNYTLNHGDVYDVLNCTDTAYVDFVASRLAGAQSALEMGSGTGRLSLPLSSKVSDYTGIERDPVMIDIARRKATEIGAEITFVQSDFTEAHLDRSYDFIFFSRDTLALVSKPERRLAALRCVKRHLNPGGSGLIILANLALYLSDGLTRQNEKTAQDVDGTTLHLKSERQFCPMNMTWTGTDQMTRYTATEQIWQEASVSHGAVTLEELRLLFCILGFEIHFLFGAYDASSFTDDSPRLIVEFGHAENER